MDKSNVMNLCSRAYTTNIYGVEEFVETKRQVYCHVDSVTGSEFFNGGQNGIKPELRFTMFFADYDGEETVEYEGQYFTVYRTYISSKDDIELYVTRRKGS